MRFLYGILTILFIWGCAGKSPVREGVFHVLGNNEMCKKTIEEACKMKGVSSADWHMDSKLLTLKVDTTLVTFDEVLQSVASVGYDNEKFFGNDYAYGALPESCQYERLPHEMK